MNEKHFSRLDQVSGLLLLLWAGMALGIAALAAPAAFHQLPSRELAGRVIGAAFRRLDWLAWPAFGLPFLSSYGTRWFAELKDGGAGIGPLRLWSAAALAALLMCFTSMVIVNPRMEAIRARFPGPVENLAENHPDRIAFNRAHRIAEQLLVLRILLGLGLAIGVAYLPRRNEEPAEN